MHRGNLKKRLFQAGSILCLAGIAVPGVAAEQSAKSGIEEIVVTANKRSEALSKVGSTVQALSDKQLDQQHVTSLSDLANAVPGLTYTESEYGTPVYTLRGVGFYETSLAAYPDVSVYLDQAPLPFPVQTRLTLFDLQRVEVLMGPQGTLFGNNATGGAINYIANKPTPDFHAGASLSYGRYNTFQGDGFVSGPITPKLSARFAFNVTEGDGWQKSDAQPLPPNVVAGILSTWPLADMTQHTHAGDTNGAQDKVAMRGIFDWTPTDDLRVELNVNGWHDGTEPQQPQYYLSKPNFSAVSGIPGGTIFPPGSSLPFPYLVQGQYNNEPTVSGDATVADWPGGQNAPFADNTLGQVTLRADYDLSDTITLTSITNYVDYEQDNNPQGGGSQWYDSDVIRSEGYAKTFSQELRIAGGGKSRDRWIAGLNYEYDTVYERDFLNFSQGGSARIYGNANDALPVLFGINPLRTPEIGSTFDSRQIMANYAVFANNEFDITRQITLKAGIRATQANRTDDACVESSSGTSLDSPTEINNFLFAVFGGGVVPVPNQCFQVDAQTGKLIPKYKNHLNQGNISWHVGLDWRPTDNITAYANLAKGYKAGSFPTLPGTTTLSQEPVTQESVVDYEVGVKSQFLDGRLAVNGDVFYYNYKNKQLKGRLSDPVFGILNALVNIPKSTVQGAELQIHGRPVPGLDVGAQMIYIYASINEFTGYNASGISQNFAHSLVPYTPRWQLSGNVNYEHPITDALTGFVGAQINFRSATSSAIGSPQYYGIPSYTTLDLQAGINTADNRWRVFVWGKNVTNKYYLTNVVDGEDAILRYTGMPATYGLTVAYHY